MPVSGRSHLLAGGRRAAHFDDAGAQLAMVHCVLSTWPANTAPEMGAFVNPSHGWKDRLVRKHMYIKRTVRRENVYVVLMMDGYIHLRTRFFVLFL